jgi:hypothetical protein
MRSLGQVAYEAYRNHTGGVSLVSGAKIPEWQELNVEIKAAWNAAAAAIANMFAE